MEHADLDGARNAPEPEELPPIEMPPPPAPVEPSFGRARDNKAPLSEEEIKKAYAKFVNTDLTVVGEVLERLAQYPALGTPYDLDVRVTPVGGTGVLGRFELHEILAVGLGGEMSPPDRMRDIVIEKFHLPTASGPVTYDVAVVWRKTGRVYARFRMPVPSRDQILAVRRAESDARQRAGSVPQQPPGYGYVPEYGSPDRARVRPPEYARGPEYGTGSPGNPSALVAELAAMRGALSEALAAAREGRRPNEETLRAAMGPQDEVTQLRSEVGRLAGLVERLITGAAPAPAAPVPPAPAPAQPATVAAPPPPNPFETVVRGGIEKVLMGVLKTTLSGMENAISAGLGAPPAAAEPSEPAEPIAPHDPKDDMEFELIDVAKWSDGRDVKFARNKTTGGVHWMGIAAGNPVLTETAMGIIDRLVQPVANFMNDKLTGGAPHVVNETPRGAVSGHAHVTPPPAASPPPRPAPPPPPPAPSAYPGM